MSDDIPCDVCGKNGRRRRGKHCPEGWFYAEYVSEEDFESGPTVVAVCSMECRDRFWLPGPGDLRTSPSYVLAPKANRNVKEVLDFSVNDEGRDP
jgi:hypothetical protein